MTARRKKQHRRPRYEDDTCMVMFVLSLGFGFDRLVETSIVEEIPRYTHMLNRARLNAYVTWLARVHV